MRRSAPQKIVVGAGSNKSLGYGPAGEAELAIFPENSWVNYVNDRIKVGVGRENVPKIGRGGVVIGWKDRQFRAFFGKLCGDGWEGGKIRYGSSPPGQNSRPEKW